MKQRTALLFFMLLTIISCTSKNKKTTIAAAANLRYVLEEIKTQYLKDNPELDLQITYGSSGTLTQQIINGAHFNLFLSADTIFPKKIEEKGLADSPIKNYCYGKVALWSSSIDVNQGLNVLLSPQVKKIAIANPEQAPYGKNTVNALKKQGLYNQIVNKIVWGENINQTAQFASSGNAEVGFIALSLALSPEMVSKGKYYLLPESVCSPIPQAAVLIKGQEKNEEADNFLNYMISSKCNDIWKKYGYGLANNQ